MPPATENARLLGPIKETFAEILALQIEYSPNNTERMQRRGILVRRQLRDQIFARIEKLRPIFAPHGYQCAVEGKDGIGRKAMSAWTRIYDPQSSPSATAGWYIVIHFSSKGDYFYLTLGCGATKFRDGSLAHVAPAELARKIKWARRIADAGFHDAGRFQDEVKLHGNDLSAQFEAATALAKRYSPQAFSESEFWSDLDLLCRILVKIYDAEKGAPALAGQTSGDKRSVAKHESNFQVNSGRGQGYHLSHEQRIAVERRAMIVVEQELVARGFIGIKDTSAVEPYDFVASKGGQKWYVEVKGTTSPNPDAFLLTANELSLHQANRGSTILAIVHGIKLQKELPAPMAMGGRLCIEEPWDPENWEFKPTAYSAVRKATSSAGGSSV